MEVFKIKKSEYSNIEKLLRRVGAVYGKKAYPSHVYISTEDRAQFQSSHFKVEKKGRPWVTKKYFQSAFGLLWLNIGPIELKSGIEKGYILVDSKAIRAQIVKDHNQAEL
jgi:hypothetical protein